MSIIDGDGDVLYCAIQNNENNNFVSSVKVEVGQEGRLSRRVKKLVLDIGA